MKLVKTQLALFVCLAVAGMGTREARAQYTIPAGVVGNGGGSGTSTNYSLSGTVNQTGVGTVSGPNNSVQGGFWYAAGSAVSTVPVVTFQVDARPAIAWGHFNPSGDSLILRGDASPLTFFTNDFLLTDGNNDSIYTITVTFDTTGSLSYKFVVRHDGFDIWEFDSSGTQGNRTHELLAGTYSLPAVSYSGLTPYAANTGEYSRDGSALALWHLNEDSSEAFFHVANSGQVMFDQSGKGNHGYTRGAPVLVDGRFGKARAFNGGSDLITTVDPVLSASAPTFSIEAWVWIDSYPGSNANVFQNASSLETFLTIRPSGKIHLGIRASDGSSRLDSSNVPLALGKWNHVAATYNHSTFTMKGYIDGGNVFSETFSAFTPSSSVTGGATIGNGTPANFPLVGQVDEVRISGVARSPNEFDLQLPPINLATVQSGGGIELSWQNGGGGVPLLEYRVYRGLDSTDVSFIATATATSLTDGDVVGGTTYFYRVAAVDETGFESAGSYAKGQMAPTTVFAEVEPNNDTTSAQLIELGNTVFASINPTSDIDYFKFSALNGDTIKILIDTTSGSELYTRFEVYHQDGYWVGGNWSWYNNHEVNIIIYDNATYFLRITNTSNYSSSFPTSPGGEEQPAFLATRNQPTPSLVAGSVADYDTGGYRLKLERFTPGAPIYIFDYPDGIFSNSVALRGAVSPNGFTTTVTYEYGTTTALGNSVVAQPDPITGIDAYYYSTADISGLSPNTDHYYRLVATNSAGTFQGDIHFFRTAPLSAEWTRQLPGTSNYLLGVSFADENTGIVVGQDGLILRTTDRGTTWASRSSPVVNWLYAVAHAGTNTVVAVGEGNEIARSTDGGSSWTSVLNPSTTGYALAGIFFVDANQGHAVGSDGMYIRTIDGGLTWNEGVSGTSEYLRSVAFGDANTGVMVGWGGTIRQTIDGGNSWNPVSAPPTSYLNAVRYINPSTVIAAGYYAILRSTDGGSTWNDVTGNAWGWLSGIHFRDQSTGFISGPSGIVWKTTDGGLTWNQEQTSTYNYLNAISGSGRSTVAVGDYGAVMINLGPLAEAEPNNSASQAQSIAYGDRVNARINTTTDVDYYKFMASAGDTVDIFGLSEGISDLEGYFLLYDSVGTLYGIGDFPTFKRQHLVWKAPESKTYYIRYANPFNSPGNFPNSSPERDDAQLRPSLVPGSTTAAGDTGNYQLTLRKFLPSRPDVRAEFLASSFANTSVIRLRVSANGVGTQVRVQYGTTSGYGSEVSPSVTFDGINSLYPDVTIPGLTPSTTYQFRIVAENSVGTTTSQNYSFTTPPASDVWVRQTGDTLPQVLWGSSFSAPSSGVAVGTNGTIVRTTNSGATWTRSAVSITDPLRDVQMVNASVGYAVGSNGAVVKTTNGGASWSVLALGSSIPLRTVYFVDANIGYIAGFNGSIFKTTNGGSTWTPQTSGVTDPLYGLFFVDQNAGWVTSLVGNILKTTNGGTTWTAQTSGTSNWLTDSYFLNSSTGFVVGDVGTILRTTNGGTNWNPVSSPSGTWLTRVTFSNSTDGIITGDFGTVLRTTNGGATWVSEQSGTYNALLGASAPHADSTTVVGNFGTILRSVRALSAPAAPTLASPISGATNQPRSLTLRWNPAPTATSYRLQVNTNSSFTGTVVVDDSTIVDTSRTISGLAYGTQYYWRVRAKNSAGSGSYSSTANFTTEALQAPAAVTLVNPPDGATNLSVDVTFRWNRSSLASEYRFMLATDPSFGLAQMVKDSTLVDTAATLSGLASGTTFYWRVIASNSAGSSNSADFDFATAAAAAPQVASVTVSGVTTSSAIVSTSVNPNGTATLAYFQWGTTTSYGNNTSIRNLGAGTISVTITDTLRPLDNNTTYNVRLSATNSGGEANSDNVAFTTGLFLPAAASDLVASLAGVTKVNLVWNDNSVNEDGFRIERKTSPTGSYGLRTTVGANVTTYQDTGLTVNTTYYYRVLAYNGAGSAPSSNEVSITPSEIALISLSPDVVNFGSREAALQTRDTVVSVTNIGGGNLFGTISLDGPDAAHFALVNGGGLFLLSPGQSQAVTVRFAPIGVGVKTAHLVVSSNDTTKGEPKGTVVDTLRGTGIDTTPPGTPALLTVSPSGWSNRSTFAVSFVPPPDISGLANVWYRYDLPPDALNPGVSAPVTGGNAAVINAPSTLGIHLVYCYLEDGSGNKQTSNVSSDTVFFDNELPVITHDPGTVGTVTVAGGTVSGTASVSATATKTTPGLSPITGMTLRWKKSGDATFSNTINYSGASGSVDIPSTAFVTGSTPNGVDYYISTTDAAGNMKSTASYSVNVEVPTASELPTAPPPASQYATEAEQVQAYRMFSVPLDLDIKKPSSYMPSIGEHQVDNVDYANWRFQRLLSNQSYEDYEAFKDADVTEPGRAFFLIVYDANKKITVGAGSVPNAQQLNDNGISLHAGWNLVGSPFDRAIPAESLRVAAGATIQNIAYFSGTWTNTANGAGLQLRPWEGLAVRVDAATNLYFKSMPAQTSRQNLPDVPARRPLEQVVQKEGEGWLMKLSAERLDANARADNKILGMAEGSLAGYDENDWYEPPHAGIGVVLYFKGEEGALERDLRPVSPDGDVWDVKVLAGRTPARLKLTTDDLVNAKETGFKMYLLDLDQRMAHDLLKQSSVEFTSHPAGRNFRLLIGTPDFVAQRAEGIELVPTTMKLFTNYPNPFNPETIIRYTIPGLKPQYRVSLKVYNLIGQEVATIIDRDQDAGYYEVKFNGAGFSSGTYIYRIIVSGGTSESTYSDVKKMVLIK